MGEGYVTYCNIVWKYGNMHTKWAPQNVISQSIVQGTFEHFLKGDKHDELWICSMNCCTIYWKSF
jgi:hypothetical protein